jgi:hypothetical protein
MNDPGMLADQTRAESIAAKRVAFQKNNDADNSETNGDA